MYYMGDSAIPVRPVTRRLTLTRGQHRRVGKKYLQRQGRKPLNRHAYPTMGTPVAVDLSMQPGHFGGIPDDAFSMKGLNPLTKVGPSVLAIQTRSGRRVMVRPFDPFSPVSLGASILDPLSITSNFTPSIPSVVAAPPPASSGWGLVDSVVSLWNARPQVLKDIKIRINPAQAAQAAGLTPAQVQNAVNYARQMGLDPSYRGVPITGAGANAGYRIAGMDLGQYLPWIIGGGAALILLPMLMRK